MTKIATPSQRQGLPNDFVILFRKNITLILQELRITNREFARRCGISRCYINNMLNRDDYYLNSMQAAAVLYYVGTLLDDAWDSNRFAHFEIRRNRWYLELTDYLDSCSRKKNTPDNEGAKTPRKEKEP